MQGSGSLSLWGARGMTRRTGSGAVLTRTRPEALTLMGFRTLGRLFNLSKSQHLQLSRNTWSVCQPYSKNFFFFCCEGVFIYFFISFFLVPVLLAYSDILVSGTQYSDVTILFVTQGSSRSVYS